MMMTIEIDPRDYMDPDDWKKLRKEALGELLNKGLCYLDKHSFVDDLVEARRAVLGKRPADAIHYIERALNEVQR